MGYTDLIPENEIGKRYGRWTIIDIAPPPETHKMYEFENDINNKFFLCECGCNKHTRKVIRFPNLKYERDKSCGCIREEQRIEKFKKKYIGNKYNMLTPVKISRIDGKKIYFDCLCDCGKHKDIERRNLGYIKSCGCQKSETTKEFNKKTKKKYNIYEFKDDIGIGYTSDGRNFIFDKEDFDKIKNYCWYITSDNYVATTDNNNHQTILLHRYVSNITPEDYKNGIIADHIHGIRRDNRKKVLRITNASVNAINHANQECDPYDCSGVTWDKHKNCWYSYIGVNKKHIYLGYFDNFDDAVKVRKEAENKYFKEYSRENSIESLEENIIKEAKEILNV